jgi:hypothetical protein
MLSFAVRHWLKRLRAHDLARNVQQCARSSIETFTLSCAHAQRHVIETCACQPASSEQTPRILYACWNNSGFHIVAKFIQKKHVVIPYNSRLGICNLSSSKLSEFDCFFLSNRANIHFLPACRRAAHLSQRVFVGETKHWFTNWPKPHTPRHIASKCLLPQHFFPIIKPLSPQKKKTIVCSAYQRVFLALSFSRSMLRFASPNNFHQAKQCYFQIFNIHIPNDIFPPKICHHHDPSVLARVHSKITKSSLVSHVGSTKIRTNANLTSILDHYSAKVPKGGAPFVTQPIVDGLHSKLRRRHFTTHLFLVPIFFWSVNPDWANNF